MSLFQEVLDSGRIPSTWRQGIITNLSSPGDPTDCGNYSGITGDGTLLPAIDKLFMEVLATHRGSYPEKLRDPCAMAMFVAAAAPCAMPLEN